MFYPIPGVPLGLNGLEVVLVTVAVCGIVGLGLCLGWSKREVAVCLLPVLPFLVLTAAEATQFMTNDEWGITIELFDPAQRALRQVALGTFHTGLLLALPITRLAELAGISAEATRMILKAV